MSKVRLEAFTDGVFAIAATLLILHVTADAPGARLGRALTHAWPQYAAYVLAFVMIGIWWVNHHAYMMVIDHVDRTLLLAHIFFLVCIAFTPFPTSLVAEHFHDGGLRAATFLFGTDHDGGGLRHVVHLAPLRSRTSPHRGRHGRAGHQATLARRSHRRALERRGDAPRALAALRGARNIRHRSRSSTCSAGHCSSAPEAAPRRAPRAAHTADNLELRALMA